MWTLSQDTKIQIQVFVNVFLLQFSMFFWVPYFDLVITYHLPKNGQLYLGDASTSTKSVIAEKS